MDSTNGKVLGTLRVSKLGACSFCRCHVVFLSGGCQKGKQQRTGRVMPGIARLLFDLDSFLRRPFLSEGAQGRTQFEAHRSS